MRRNLENWKKLELVCIMNSVGMNSKNIVNSVGVIINNILSECTRMNNVSCE